MNPPNQPPHWTRQLAEDEEVQAAYERRCALRAMLPAIRSPFVLSEAVEDRLDWLAAEREIGRVVEAHGRWADERP